MKFQRTPERTSIAIYAFLVAAAVIVFFHLFGQLNAVIRWIGTFFGYIQPIVYGFMIAFLLNPMLRKFECRFLPWISKGKLSAKVRRPIAMLMTYMIVLALLSVFIWIVLPQVLASLGNIINQLPTYWNTLRSGYEEMMTAINKLNISEDTSQALRSLGDRLTATVEQSLSGISAWLIDSMGVIASFTTGVVKNMTQLVLGLVISFYFLADREKMLAGLRKGLYAALPKGRAEHLCEIAVEASHIFSGYVVGAITDAMIVGLTCFVFMTIFGWEYAVLISVVVSVSNLIPYIGPFIGAAISAMLLLTVNPPHALGFIVFILILQQIDGNILVPRIVGQSTGVPPLGVVFAVMIFGGYFGIMGFFVGVPVFAVIYSLLKRLINYLLKRKGMSQDTRDYASEQNPMLK